MICILVIYKQDAGHAGEIHSRVAWAGSRAPMSRLHVEVMDLLLMFFGDGERWVKGRLSDRRGNRCLIGALDFVSSHHGMKGDGAERYLADEIFAAGDCNNAGWDCARFRASLRRGLSGGRL